MIRPVTAYVLFETQEGQQRCFENFLTSTNVFGGHKWKKKALTILEHPVQLEVASEPTDINWLN